MLARPVAYFSANNTEGQDGCDAPKCVREVLGIGTPALWWAATAALLYMLWRWAGARDWRAGAVLAGVAAGWLPWFRYGDRPIFYFYAIAFLPFLILAVTLTARRHHRAPAAPGTSEAAAPSRRRRAIGAAVAGSVVALVVVNFFYLYPLLTAGSLSPPGLAGPDVVPQLDLTRRQSDRHERGGARMDLSPRGLARSAGLVGAAAQNALEVARFGGLQTGEEPSEFEVVARRRMYRLRHYFPDAPGAGPALLSSPR